MNTRTLLATTAVTALIFGAAVNANAQNVSVTGSYSLTAVSGGATLNTGDVSIDMGNTGGPTVETLGNTTGGTSGTGGIYNSSVSALTGAPYTPTNSGATSSYMFQVAPGGGNPQSGTVDAHFTVSYNGGSSINLYTTANFQAQDFGTGGCTIGAGCDSIAWTGALSYGANNSSSGVSEIGAFGSIGSNDELTGGSSYTGEGASPADCNSNAGISCGYAEYAINLGSGNGTLDIFLQDDEDWDIGSAIQLEYTASTGGGSVPEPASMALFATGLVGLGAIRRRMTRKARKAA
jgi:hypothetical protein